MTAKNVKKHRRRGGKCAKLGTQTRMRIKKSAVPCLPAARVFAWRHQVFSDRPDYLQFARVS
ncbi:MAG: hypothetical protein ACHQT6_03455 [Candidatus Acidiferrales bacterium]